jgi:hypothetical protein
MGGLVSTVLLRLLQVEGAKSHAQMEQDWYMLTVAADLLAFLYAAMFYQVGPQTLLPGSYHVMACCVVQNVIRFQHAILQCYRGAS